MKSVLEMYNILSKQRDILAVADELFSVWPECYLDAPKYIPFDAHKVDDKCPKLFIFSLAEFN